MYASGTTSKWLPMQCPIKGLSSILPQIRICLSETEESAATSEKVPAVDISLGHLRALTSPSRFPTSSIGLSRGMGLTFLD